MTYGLLRYLNPDVALDAADPAIGFNYLGRLGTGELSDDLWRMDADAQSLLSAAAAIDMPLMHTVGVNAGTLDAESGPALQASWTWATAALDDEQVHRLSRLWFRRAGRDLHPCTQRRRRSHPVGHPSGTAESGPDRIAEPAIRNRRCFAADPGSAGTVVPPTFTRGADNIYAVQLDIALAGELDPHRLRDAVGTVIKRHPNLAARFCEDFDQPVQVIAAEPVIAWHYLELDTEEQLDKFCAAERAAVGDPTNEPTFRAALVRTAPDRHRFVLTNHHIVLDGWSLPILLQEIFAATTATDYPNLRPIAGSSPGWPVRIGMRRRRRGARCSTVSTRRLSSVHRAAWRWVRVVSNRSRCPRRSPTRSPNWPAAGRQRSGTVLQAGWAQVLMMLTGRSDVAFGTAVSGRPADVAGADLMVGLLINTVPVRARVTASDTVADLLEQLQREHNDTLEHEHLALTEIHHLVGHEQMFDTLFVYENYRWTPQRCWATAG